MHPWLRNISHQANFDKFWEDLEIFFFVLLQTDADLKIFGNFLSRSATSSHWTSSSRLQIMENKNFFKSYDPLSKPFFPLSWSGAHLLRNFEKRGQKSPFYPSFSISLCTWRHLGRMAISQPKMGHFKWNNTLKKYTLSKFSRKGFQYRFQIQKGTQKWPPIAHYTPRNF